MASITTACPRNCYSTCALRVEVEEGRVRRIAPCQGNRATAGGPCLKGLSYVERVGSADRIVRPLLRGRGGGGFEPISWEAALDLLAERLEHYRREPGPRSVMFYCGSGAKGLLNEIGTQFWRGYGGYTTTYGDLCWPAGLEATRLTLGANEHNAPWDIARARLILLWGKNPAETNVHQMSFLEEARARGAKLIVIDPRRTESAERAELLVQPRPGSDGALALAIAHRLIAAGWIDREFIDQHVLGFQEFARLAARWPPARAAQICGLEVDHIERLAGNLGTLRPATICAGFGMQRYTNSGQTMRALIALLALTGNLGKAGAGWRFANLQSHVFGGQRDPLAFYPPARDDGIARISIATGKLGSDMLATRDPALKMIWIERANPVTQNPETPAVLRALRALEFRVVVEQFLTDTAREADLVLPARSFLEQSDIITAYWHPYIQLVRKVLEPPPQVKPESEIYRLLAGRLGIEGDFPGPREADIEAWLEGRLEPVAGLDLASLKAGPRLPPGHHEVAFEDRVFPTPSGRVELLSAEAARRWGVDPLPDWREPEEWSGLPLRLLTPNTKNRIHSQFGNLQLIRAVDPGPALRISPADADPRGIGDGDRVRLFNQRGHLEVPARIDHSLRAGCVALSNGWWIEEGAAVNLLSQGRETDMGHGAAFHDNLIEVERVP